MKDYKDGEKVAVEIKSWEKPKDSPQGRIIKSFGFGDDALDAYSILYEYGLSTEFEQEVEDEAAKIKPIIKKEEIKKRRDMRGTMTFTIDPVDAKDFDDAISFKVLGENKYEVGGSYSRRFTLCYSGIKNRRRGSKQGNLSLSCR